MSLDFTLSISVDTGGLEPIRVQLYDGNITHNLTEMATAAGIYGCLWRPEENGISCAGDMIGPLSDGLALLEADPERFRKHDASNGWGTYEHFVPFVREVLASCKAHPKSIVEVWR